jgi:hypothetical protein
MAHDDLQHISGMPEIPRVEVDPDAIKAFTTNSDFMWLAVELLKEVASYTCYAAALTDETGTWSRDEAVVSGNMIRLYKLMHVILDQTTQKRGEIAFTIFRMAFETIVNTRYLIKHHSPDLVTSFITYSLKHERKLFNRINENIAARSGVVLPIEERMLRSLNRAAQSAGVTYDQVDMKQKNWGGRNIYDKTEDLDWREQYAGAFAGPSHNVHGNWHDLYSSHLEWDGGERFTPKFDFARPRPQPIFALCVLATDCLYDFYSFKAGHLGLEVLWPPVNDLQQRAIAADHAHEAYLSGKRWPEI